MQIISIAVLIGWVLDDPPLWKIKEYESEIIAEDGTLTITTDYMGYCNYYELEYLLPMIALTFLSALMGHCMSQRMPESLPQELNDAKQMRSEEHTV